MMLKRWMSLILIGSQISYTALAAASAGPRQSPEFILLKNVISIQGEDLSPAQLQDQLKNTMARYFSVASRIGGLERMRQALVELGVYTPDQAAAFAADAQTAAANVAFAHPSTIEGASDALSSEIMQLTTLHPLGAQFASCGTAKHVANGAFLTAFGLASASLYFLFNYTNCVADGWGDYGMPAVNCTGPVSPHDLHLGYGLLIGGGVIAGVGALALALEHGGC